MKQPNKAKIECDKHQPLCIDNGECPYYFEEEDESCIVADLISKTETPTISDKTLDRIEQEVTPEQ